MAALLKQLQFEQQNSTLLARHISMELFYIEMHEGYEKYLQSIVDVLPPDYLDVHEPQINDIIKRHTTLKETNQDLFTEVAKNQDQIEKSHGKLLALVKEKNDLLLVYNSKIGSKQKYLDKLKQENLAAEEQLEQKSSIGKERVAALLR